MPVVPESGFRTFPHRDLYGQKIFLERNHVIYDYKSSEPDC